MLNFVLCDDNKSVLSKLSSMLDSIFIDNHFDGCVSYTATNADDFFNYVNNNHVDVLLLDINLKENMSGLHLAKKIRENDKNVYIIFTTAHLEYMLLAYQFKTFDFIPKPITKQRLESTVTRLFDDIQSGSKKFLKLSTKNTIIDKDDIKFIKRDGMKLIFFTDNRTYEAYSSFNKITKQLSNNFVRCHKSYIANINQISDVQANTNTILFKGSTKEKCYIDYKYKNYFMEVLNHYES